MYLEKFAVYLFDQNRCLYKHAVFSLSAWDPARDKTLIDLVKRNLRMMFHSEPIGTFVFFSGGGLSVISPPGQGRREIAYPMLFVIGENGEML